MPGLGPSCLPFPPRHYLLCFLNASASNPSFRQICQGLKSIHDQCIVHLDLKPENILFESSKSSSLKLIDFGLAAKLDPEVVAKVSVATAEFAAPEIVNRDAVGYYTGVYEG